MRRSDTTNLGGLKRAFETTRWTELLCAKSPDTQARRQVVGKVIARYWKPVYCYLRRRGHAPEEAKDLTQGFFAEVVLGRDLIRRADREKGKFRTFLLTALNRYATSARRKDLARKRAPEGGLLRLDGFDEGSPLEPVDCATPEAAFHHQWVSALLDHAIAEVRDWYIRGGKASHWHAFRAVILAPILEDRPTPPLADVCAQFGIKDEATASNMIITVKRRFRESLRGQVRESLDSDKAVEQEISDLARALS